MIGRHPWGVVDKRHKQRVLPVVTVIVAAAVSAVATLLVVGGKRQSALAEEIVRLRTESEEARGTVVEADNRVRRARSQAGELIAHFVDTLHRELQPLARSDILEDSARQAAEYFESLPPGEIPRTLINATRRRCCSLPGRIMSRVPCGNLSPPSKRRSPC